MNFAFTFLVRRSYFLNYLYWLFPHPGELSDYNGYLKQNFSDPWIMDQHRKDLDSLVWYASQRNIPFTAVVFPLLPDPEGYRFATDPIESFFAERGVPYVSVRELVEGLPTEKIVVNPNDGHPSVYLHHLVADELLPLVAGN